MVGRRSKTLERPSLNRDEEVAYSITYHPPTMLYWVLSPGSLTAIHTWAYLALATYMKACYVIYPQVALMTLVS